LRRSLFASTIFPVFLVIIIGLVSFYAIYIWIELTSPIIMTRNTGKIVDANNDRLN
jgi:hypothetical protein